MTNFIFSVEDYVTAGTALGGKEKWGGGGAKCIWDNRGLRSGVAEATSSDRLLQSTMARGKENSAVCSAAGRLSALVFGLHFRTSKYSSMPKQDCSLAVVVGNGFSAAHQNSLKLSASLLVVLLNVLRCQLTY